MRTTAPLERRALALNGGTVTAYAHSASRTRFAAIYPITPSSIAPEVLSKWSPLSSIGKMQIESNAASLSASSISPLELAKWSAEKNIKIKVHQTESELSAIAIAIPAGLHVRTATFTGGNGLTYMTEVMPNAAALQSTLNIDVSCRNYGGNINIWGDWMDLYTMTNMGTIILVAKNNQRDFDNTPIGYRVAEDLTVRSPFMTAKRGFDGTHIVEPTKIVPPEVIDEFLPPFVSMANLFDTENPVALGTMLYPGSDGTAGAYTRNRINTQWGLDNSKAVYKKAWAEYQEKVYGPNWKDNEDEYYIPHDGLFDWHGLEKARKVIITMGPDAETAELVNRNYLMHTDINDTAVIHINMFHPYPGEELIERLEKAGVKAIAVVDQALPFSWGGTFHKLLVATAISDHWQNGKRPKLLNFSGGVGGDEITYEDFQCVFNVLNNAVNGAPYEKVYYLGVPERSILGTEENIEWMANHINPNVSKYFEERRLIYEKQQRDPQYYPDMDQVLELEETTIHGFGGEGNVLIGELLTQAAIEGLGKFMVCTPLFGSAKKQQYVNVTIAQSLGEVGIRRPSGRPHHSIVYNMAAFDEESRGRKILATTRDSLVINTSRSLESIDSQLRTLDPNFKARLYTVDASGLARKDHTDFFNMYMLGATLKVTRELNFNEILKYLEKSLSPEWIKQITLGYEAVKDRDSN